MEEKQIGEQPIKEESNVQEEIVKNEEIGTTSDDLQIGSLGKFKDTESLMNAYNNLQADYTRKCQKLSEVSKKLEDLETDAKQKAEIAPVYKGETWKEDVSAFLMKNQEAKEYASEIANEILQDENLQKSPDALELAWTRIMKKEYAHPKTLAQNNDFINNKILSQENVRQKVLNEYFTNIQKTKTPPIIASTGVVASVSQKQPTSLSEAKAMVEKLFNLKG